LYALSHIKQTEISVRTSSFIDQEFKFLLPFYVHPALKLQSTPLNDKDFIGIERDYLKATLLISQASRTVKVGNRIQNIVIHKENLIEAQKLLEAVNKNANFLEEPYQTYFHIHAQLKIAEILARSEKKKEALEMFEKIEEKVNKLSNDFKAKMAWTAHSFLAELYYEWANLLLFLGRGTEAAKKAETAIEFCYLSDSLYDYEKRIPAILINFTNYSNVSEKNRELQEVYGREYQ
jgi:tetratricopeptide (TPR) repeat protein